MPDWKIAAEMALCTASIEMHLTLSNSEPFACTQLRAADGVESLIPANKLKACARRLDVYPRAVSRAGDGALATSQGRATQMTLLAAIQGQTPGRRQSAVLLDVSWHQAKLASTVLPSVDRSRY